MSIHECEVSVLGFIDSLPDTRFELIKPVPYYLRREGDLVIVSQPDLQIWESGTNEQEAKRALTEFLIGDFRNLVLSRDPLSEDAREIATKYREFMRLRE